MNLSEPKADAVHIEKAYSASQDLGADNSTHAVDLLAMIEMNVFEPGERGACDHEYELRVVGVED